MSTAIRKAYIFCLLLLFIQNNYVYSQTLGEAVHSVFGKNMTMIVSEQGNDYHQDTDKFGKTFIAYKRVFNQNGKDVEGFSIFHFHNGHVSQYTTVISQENLMFWQNEFKKKLIRRDDNFWIEPDYNLVWNLKIENNYLYITAIDNNSLKFLNPNAFGQNWTKSLEAEFMKNCVYGNPNNVGNETVIQPMCSCALEKIKSFYSDAQAASKLTSDELAKLLQSCLK